MMSSEGSFIIISSPSTFSEILSSSTFVRSSDSFCFGNTTSTSILGSKCCSSFLSSSSLSGSSFSELRISSGGERAMFSGFVKVNSPVPVLNSFCLANVCTRLCRTSLLRLTVCSSGGLKSNSISSSTDSLVST